MVESWGVEPQSKIRYLQELDMLKGGVLDSRALRPQTHTRKKPKSFSISQALIQRQLAKVTTKQAR